MNRVDFNAMLDWKLQRGSHRFPGPSGGTCVLEAAVVAGGEPYRPIHNYREAPEHFSPAVSLLALIINDTVIDDVRQRLVPFITRIPHSRGSDEVETARVSRLFNFAFPSSTLESHSLEDVDYLWGPMIFSLTRPTSVIDEALHVLDELLKMGPERTEDEGVLIDRLNSVKSESLSITFEELGIV